MKPTSIIRRLRFRLNFYLLLLLLLCNGAARAGVTNCVIKIPVLDVGNYDINGEHSSLDQDSTAGKLSYQAARNPRRSWFAFHIPNFPGTLTGTVFKPYFGSSAYVVSSSSTLNFELREVVTPVETLRRGGFGLTNIFDDLANGPVYASATLPTGYVTFAPSLSTDFVFAATAARGSDIALGGSIPGLNLASPAEERVTILAASSELKLELQLSAPEEPIIYAQPATDPLFFGSNSVSLIAGASGAQPLTYRWFLNGSNTYTADEFPNFQVQNLSGIPRSAFVIVSNAFGMATSSVVQVKLGPETFKLNFSSLVARVDDTVSFSLNNYYPYTITWYKYSTSLGPLGVFWQIPAVRTNDAGDYHAVVSGSFGSVTTAVAHLEVMESPPAIWQNPVNSSVGAGTCVSEYPVVVGGPKPDIRWFHDATLLPGQTNQTLMVCGAQSSDAGNYYFTASNRLGMVTSQVAAVTIYTAPPVFTQHPTNRTAPYGSTVQIQTLATGNPSPSYQWFHNGASAVGAFGTNSPAFLIFNATVADAGQYYCVASNIAGIATSQVATLTIITNPPAFTQQPTNRTALYGSTVQIDSFATGDPSPSFQWFHNGTPAVGAFGPNSSAFLIYNATVADAGQYYCVASNIAGIATSQVATLTIITNPPVFTSQPTNQTVPYGGTAQFRATATGTPTPTLRWYRNGTLFAATNGTVTIFNVTFAEAGSYYCIASNISGMATSQVATLTVITNPPVFTLHPANRTVYYGGNAQFSVAATGNPAPTYRWFHDGVPLSSNFFANIGLYPVTTADAGSWFCIASNFGGVATSQVATLTVITVPPILSGPADLALPVGANLAWLVGLSNPPAVATLIFEQTNAMQTLNFNSTLNIFQFGNIPTNFSGHYVVVASNQFGISTSRVATLTITTAPPTVALYVNDPVIIEGGNVEFYATVTGSPTPFVSLYHNGNPIAPYDIQDWRLSSVTTADEGDYIAVASNLVGTATATVHLTVQRAGPLDKWTIRNPIPFGRDLHSIVWAQNQFVTVGDNGAVLSSADGTNWTVRNAHTADNLFGIAYGGGRFVAVGDGGKAFSSTNGETWSMSLIDTNLFLNDVTYGNGNFLGVGYNVVSFAPAAFRSSNGVNWTEMFVPATGNPYSLKTATFGAGRFVVLDYNGVAYESVNLVSWVNSINTGNSTVVPYALGSAYVNGSFIALGYGGYLNNSSDGDLWGAGYYNGVSPRQLYDIAYGGGRYIIVASKGKIFTSTGNLQSWSAVASPTTDRLEGVTFVNGVFVAVGENGTILTSFDGLSWSNQTRGANYDLDGLAVANGRAVAVGKSGTILTSTDGTTWNYVLAPGIPTELHGVAYGNGKWVAVGDSANILVSTDGQNWEVQSGFGDAPLKSVLYANGLWVIVGETGQIITSPDAITWTTRVSPTSYDLNEVTFGNGYFVIVGDNNDQPNETILVSADGIDWTDYSISNYGKNARGVGFANGLYVIALNDGEILYGTNALVTTNNPFSPRWEEAPTGVEGDGNNLRGLTWSNSLWVAVGNNGIILTSTNAQEWRQRHSPTYENLHAVRYINNTFIAIGNEGVILQSAPLTPRLFVTRNGENLRFVFSSPYEGVFKLQHTDDFTWQDLALITNSVGTVDFTVPLLPGANYKFFRVVVP